MAEEQSDAGLQETETTGDELQQTNTGTAPEDTFFDPSSLGDDPNLNAAYKQMQGAWTKRMQEASALQKRYEGRDDDLVLVDQFKKDPVSVIKHMAGQYGLNIAEQSQEFNPQNWNDVIKTAEDRAYQRLRQEMGPVMQDLHNVKKQSIESYMDGKYPDWRHYESKMTQLVTAHPSLASDPDLIYKMAVPDDIIQKRANQAALNKLKGQAESAQMTGKTTTSRTPLSPKMAGSFHEAYLMAKEEQAANTH